MNNFERGRDPKEGMDLGVAKEAIPINMITYIIEGREIQMDNPAKMRWFMKKLIAGDLPKDPIFGIEEIVLSNNIKEVVEEVDYDAMTRQRGYAGGFRDYPKKYEISERGMKYYLNDLFGKVIDIYGTLFLFPSLEDFKANKLDYLLDITKGLDEQINADNEINHELRYKKLEQEERMREEQEAEFERAKKEAAEKTKNRIGTASKEYEENKKRKWWQSVSSVMET